MTIPKDPGSSSLGTPKFLTESQDTIGIMTNGVLLDSHKATWSYDLCNGHSDKAHQYHYHLPPQCFLESLGVPIPSKVDWWIQRQAPQQIRTTTATSQVLDYSDMAAQWPSNSSGGTVLIGWALDGFPIYGPYDEDGVLQRGQQYGGDVDVCNGKTNRKGQYGYYLTVDPPFAPPCLRGIKMGTFMALTSTPPRVCPREGIVNRVFTPMELEEESCKTVAFEDILECMSKDNNKGAEETSDSSSPVIGHQAIAGVTTLMTAAVLFL